MHSYFKIENVVSGKIESKGNLEYGQNNVNELRKYNVLHPLESHCAILDVDKRRCDCVICCQLLLKWRFLPTWNYLMNLETTLRQITVYIIVKVLALKLKTFLTRVFVNTTFSNS